MSTPTVSVVVPTYGRTEALLALLADLHGQQGVTFEIIVVDDRSPVDPTSQIAARFPRVTVLRNEENGGPAVSRNRGVRAARGRIVVGFDNDVRVADASLLRRTVDEFEARPTVEGLAFRVLQPEGKDDVARWWHPVPLAEYAGRRFQTSYFSGTAYAFRREAMLAAGLFPEILYMHYEEVELAYRLLDRGGTILYCPELEVFHHAHPVSRRSEIKVFYKPRNQVLLAAACLPLGRAIAFVVPRLAFHGTRALFRGEIRGFVAALHSARTLLPRRWRQRRVLHRSTFRRLAVLRTGIPA